MNNNEIVIKQIDKNNAVNFIVNYHYSNIMPKLTKYYLGFYQDDLLIGVVTLGWGTQPLQTIKKIFPNENLETKDYLEIGKMCFLPQENDNKMTGSKIMKYLKKWLKENENISFLYTLADGIMGKVGYVYQASGFYYIGSFKTSVYYDKNTGEKIHPRSAKTLCIENARIENKEKVFWLTHNYCQYKGIEKINGLMFRYIIPLNKSAKKMIEKHYTIKENPKDKDLVFERRLENGVFKKIDMPEFNMDISNHNKQKWRVQTTLFD